uniref:WSC domain-containing protein n=1 Tax=Macrostomum lignano TaxID=282301 RepID=A0A1I8FLG7_9PLAT
YIFDGVALWPVRKDPKAGLSARTGRLPCGQECPGNRAPLLVEGSAQTRKTILATMAICAYKDDLGPICPTSFDAIRQGSSKQQQAANKLGTAAAAQRVSSVKAASAAAFVASAGPFDAASTFVTSSAGSARAASYISALNGHKAGRCNAFKGHGAAARALHTGTVSGPPEPLRPSISSRRRSRQFAKSSSPYTVGQLPPSAQLTSASAVAAAVAAARPSPTSQRRRWRITCSNCAKTLQHNSRRQRCISASVPAGPDWGKQWAASLPAVAAFQVGLYALGLYNCVNSTWQSRTYFFSCQLDTECCRQGAPATGTRGICAVAAQLCLDCLHEAHTLNSQEIRRCLDQCKDQSLEVAGEGTLRG